MFKIEGILSIGVGGKRESGSGTRSWNLAGVRDIRSITLHMPSLTKLGLCLSFFGFCLNFETDELPGLLVPRHCKELDTKI